MAKLSEVSFKGASGASYSFECYPLSSNLPDGMAVYVVTRRYESSGGYRHDPIYIGEAESVRNRFQNHHKDSCFKKHSANFLCLHWLKFEKGRKRIENDLLKKERPVCND